jgi:hypothetical protein
MVSGSLTYLPWKAPIPTPAACQRWTRWCETGLAAAELVARGLSVRDVATLLGISPQRVSQLTAQAS